MPNYDPDPDFYARYPVCAFTGKPCEGVCEHYCGALEEDEPAADAEEEDDNDGA